ncbi:exportin-1 [Nematocida sp. LUAm3]|nr:exportin-1 [Nematocida sp. LUAm3]
MEKILENTKEFDTDLYDRVVAAFYSPGGADHKRAEEVLLCFRDGSDSWARVAVILKESKNLNGKLFSLQVLERMVKIRWSVLTESQKEGVREYVIEKILEYVVAEKNMESRLLAKGLNQILREIIKREWPEKWPTLMPDLLTASRDNISVCRNTFNLLEMICDEIYNFPKSMISMRVNSLTSQMLLEFPGIFDLLSSTLNNVSLGQMPADEPLVVSSLNLLLQMVPVLPLEYIYRSGIVEVLGRYVETSFGTKAIMIMNVFISKRNPDNEKEADPQEFFEVLRSFFITVNAFTEGFFHKFKEMYNCRLRSKYSEMEEEPQELLKQIILFYTGAYAYAKNLEVLQCNTVAPLRYLLEISEVSDYQLFRLCSELWSMFIKDLFLEFPFSTSNKHPSGLRRQRYTEFLPQLVKVYLLQMARPQEVIITENEEGDVVLERLSETEHIVHCQEMRETLLNIAHISTESYSSFFLSKLEDLNESTWSREKINKLCWAATAITESMSAANEEVFIVQLLRKLLTMCSQKDLDGDRAVMASCILYTVSKSPRFLQRRYNFFIVVIEKVFEFMREDYIGSKEMACDTFLELGKSCGEEFSATHPGSQEPYIDKILRDLPKLIDELPFYQKESVYEALCYMVEERVGKLFSYAIEEILSCSQDKVEDLQRTAHALRKVKIICGASTSENFALSREKAIDDVLLSLQRLYEILEETSDNGNMQVKKHIILVKKEIVEVYIEITKKFSVQFILGSFIEMCSQIILAPLRTGGFTPEILDLLKTLCTRTVEGSKPLCNAIFPYVAKLVFSDPQGQEPLLVSFYGALSASVRKHPIIETIEKMEWLVFGVGHTHREISEKSIEALASALKSQSNEQIVQATFFGLLECIVGALLDKDHEGGLDALLTSFSSLIQYSIMEKCPSRTEVLDTLGGRLHQTFSHLHPEDIQEFVTRSYEGVHSHELLSTNVDDFRVKIRTV